MNTKHTPGPWKFDETVHDNRERCFVRSTVLYPGADKGASVCKVTAVLGREALDANARLIAAAPDLLESLVELENMASTAANLFWKSEQWAPMAKAIMQARATIAKATRV